METLSTTRLDEIAAVAASWGVDDWDAIIVGDGSGSGWGKPAGWGAVLIDRASRGRLDCYGGSSVGTIGIAELLPYVHALSWYAAYCAQEGGGPRPVRTVCVVTDSQVTARVGRRLAAGALAPGAVANDEYWAAVAALARRGFVLRWFWIERASIALNCYADDRSKQCFAAMQEMPPVVGPDGTPVSVYDCNADEPGPTPLHGWTPRPGPRRRGRRRPPEDCQGGRRD